MAEIFTNLASSRLAASLAIGGTSLTLLTGDGDDLFPNPGGGDFFRLVLLNLATGDIEIVACTARAGDVCTITRAYEDIGNQTAQEFAFSAGDLVELRPTADFFSSLGAPTTTSIQQMDYNYAVDTGAADQYAVALSPAAASYASPMVIYFLADNTNTGASTLNVNALGVKDIKLLTGDDPVAGDIVANKVAAVIYDDGDTNFKLLNPRIPLDPSDFASLANKNVFLDTQVFAQGTALTDSAITAGVLTFTDNGNHYTLNSTEQITSIATIGVGATIGVRFLAAQEIVHDGDDITIPGGANITTEAGDEAVFYEHQIAKWRIISYTRNDGGVPNGALPDGTTAVTQAVDDNSTKVATTEYVDRKVQKFTSSEQTLSSTSANIAHGLDGKPQFVSVIMVCQSTNLGYSAGDEVIVNPAFNDVDEDSPSHQAGLSVVVSATNITWRANDPNNLGWIGKTSSWGYIDSSKWKVKFVALYIP